MDFEPDEKLLLKCVLSIEGLTDWTEVRIRRTDILDDVPAKTNNTSKVLKLRIEYEARGEAKKASVVVKVPFLRTRMVYAFFEGLRFFAKEAQFYESIAPRLRTLLRAEVAPTLLAAGEQQVLYLDDLSVRGYRVQADGQLDAEHCDLVVRHLARMHAASHVLQRQDGRLFDDDVRRQFLIGDDFIGKLYVEVGPLLAAMARTGFLSAERVGRFDVAVRKARADIAGELDSSRYDFDVLNHGDLKAHNILFEYDRRGKPVGCSLIDFQMYYWSSPVLDLIFCTILSMECEVFSKHFDELLESYVSTMNATLEELKCDTRLTKVHLRRNWDELKAMKVYSFLFRVTFDIREFCQQFDYDKFEEASPETLEKLTQSPVIQDRVRFWFEEFENTGVL